MMSLLVPFLAAYRLVRAWFWEEIGEKPRVALEDFLEKPVMTWTPKHGHVVWLGPTYVKGWLYKLITCPYCTGFWLTLGMVILRRVPLARRLVEALAAATLLCVALDHYPDKGREAAEANDEDEVTAEPGSEQVADEVDLANRER